MNSFKNILFSKSFLIFILIILGILSLIIGVQDFNIFNMFSKGSSDAQLIAISRLPRLLSIIIAGASLSIAGLIMQTITRNKFASPSTAGTMEWCKLGIMISILFFGSASNFTKMAIAFATALLGTLFFTTIISNIKFKDPSMVPLTGMMLGGVVSAVTTYFAYQYDIIQNISSWLMGSFSLVVKGQYELLFLGLPFLIIAYFYADKFTITGMGDDMAKSLGLNHKAITFIGLSIVALICATVVVSVGSIPFVGLIVPNMVSLIKGDNIRKNLFHTAISGSIFVLICDIIGRCLIFPYEISASVIISVLGSIIFLSLLFRRLRYE